MVEHFCHVGMCLAAGLVASVAVAWGAALWAPVGPLRGEHATEYESLGSDSRYRFVTETERWILKGIGVRYTTEVITSGIEMSSASSFSRSECRAGWPLTAFECRDEAHGWKPPETWPTTELMSPTIFRLLDEIGWPLPRIVPLQVQWAGLAADTSVFGLMFWMAFVGCGVGRRRLWQTRGRWGGCGYEVAGLSRCPECGVERAAVT